MKNLQELFGHKDHQHLALFLSIAGALTFIRILALVFTETNLGPDESQYWVWAQDPAFGYFSKPPLIAWAIATTTAIFGNAEWAVRLSAPFFHLGASLFLFFTAKRLFNNTTAFWVGVSWLLLPGAILSSFLITTDAPLMFCWSGAIYFLTRILLREQSTSADYAALGAMVGLGLLAKYAMIYFPIALAVLTILHPPFRKRLIQPRLGLALVTALILIAPNIWWNSQHEFQTLSHTAANANWGAGMFHLVKLFGFLLEQFAVAGPVIFTALLLLSARPKLLGTTRDDINPKLVLLVLALTPLLIVATQAFLSRAHANWAAAAYPAAILLVTGFLFESHRGWFVKAANSLHAMVMVLFIIGATNLNLVDSLSLSATTKEIRGWDDQTKNIMAMSEGYDAIAIDDRSLMGAMLYYQRDKAIEVVALDPNAGVDHHYEAFMAFDPEHHKRVLFVTTRDDDAHVNYRFRNITPLGPQTVSLGGDTARTYHLFDISGFFDHLNSTR